ncbi:MAG: CCA tRNA nucleotidyltransferase [Spirochaetales bacterium]|nr:CCA tRNA nucleotidyltransferase [Spirochaetales bacterium]
MKYSVPHKLRELAEIFEKNGFSLYLVGGAVRDYVLGLDNHDYDFTTDAEPLEVKKMFKKTIDTGIKHGTVTVLFKGGSYEITTFRTEGEYHDGRHPEKVSFVRNLDEDLKRRDFTINALAADLRTGTIIDQHDGLADIKNGVVRAIGIAEERFTEDALRMLRACRFSSKLGFEVEESTKMAISKLKENVKLVSSERIKDELFRLIDSPHPRMGLETMRETGLMDIILPELSALYGLEQGGFHKEDAYEHSILALERARDMKYPIEVKVSALLHDIGKKQTRREGETRYTFYGHEGVSERMTLGILERLKASNNEKKIILRLIREHMFSYTPEWTDGAVRRFINRVGINSLDRLYMLRDCDNAATTGEKPDNSHLEKELRTRINSELERNSALTLKDLKITGDDLMKLGIEKGPSIGKILNQLLEMVIDNPELNEKEKLSSIAREL